MITDAMAEPIARYATKSFSSMHHSYNPDQPTIKKIFFDQWDDFLNDPEVKKKGLRDVTRQEVEKMLVCGTIHAGFEVYECPSCHKSHIICYTCKSRFCPSCGVKYAKERAANVAKSCLDVKHRHIVFTIDERLRDFFLVDRNRLHLLFEAVKQTLFYVFNRNNGKDDTFKPGIIMTLHTFGRALNWNPHIHCLVTEGGVNDAHHYKPIYYIHYASLRKSFMKLILDYLSNSFNPDSKEYFQFRKLVNQIYSDKENGFYVYAPPMKSKNGNDAVVDYILRYTGRPVMAQSRIIHYDALRKGIHYFYEDHETNESVEVKEHIFKFMKKLLLHIPESQFKMIRYCGIYATCNHSHKDTLSALIAKSHHRSKREPIGYRRDLISTFNVDPLLCDCGTTMIFVDAYIPSSIGGEMNGPFS